MKLKSKDSYTGWAEDATALLRPYERRSARWTRGEITSGAMSRLLRVRLNDLRHLRSLLPRIVDQVSADLARTEQRHNAKLATTETSLLPAEGTGSGEDRRRQLETILDSSTLDTADRQLLAIVAASPEAFLWPDGRPRQAALAVVMKCNDKTAGTRWRKLCRKIASPAHDIDLA